MSVSNMKIALLIDADNISTKYLKIIFDEISTNYGTVSIKRAYGDWTTDTLKPWKSSMVEYAITPMQQFSYVAGKNSTDHAMIIDAMDILYTKEVDIFCLATSDSDFTKLVSRLRESGKTVVGFGETKTHKNYSDSCNEFKYVDKLYSNAHESEKSDDIDTSNITPLSEIKDYIYNYISSGDGEVQLGGLKSSIKAKFADFDERNYEYSKFSTFIDSFDEFKVITKGTVNSVILSFNNNEMETRIKGDIIKLLSEGKKKHFTSVEIQNAIAKKYPNFRLKSLGYSTMKSLLKSIKCVETDAQGKYYYKG
jgi:uncharacterized protein (TIGR00288 family)